MSQGLATPFLAGQQAPTVTTYTSGSGTYTVPSGVQFLVVEMCGGGGGGGGCGAGKGAGGNGGTTSFGSWTAIGGTGAIATNGPNNPSAPGAGGSGGASGAGTQVFRVAGASGGSGIGITSIGMTAQGPGGGSRLSGGNAWFQGTANVAGLIGMAQGGGGAGAAGSDNSAAGGGGGGEQVQFIISSPAATYSYAVGAGGTAGAGAAQGGAGGSGVIVIYEYYSLLGITGTLNLPLAVNQGGTGNTSTTAYAVICGGTTSTGAQQSIASVGTSGQVLTSNGAGALPTFQTLQQANIVAWINFNGSGTPTARASGNVTSITDNNVGDYTINFTNALADANYAMVSSGQNTSAGGASSAVATNTTTTPTASACRVISAVGTGGNYDATYIGLAFLR